MGKIQILWNGPKRAPLTVALAHGAGAPMDTTFMNYFAEGLSARGHRIARFEFPYMAAWRKTKQRKPPNRQPELLETWRAVTTQIEAKKLVIGGKSMGGRMATMIADAALNQGNLCGILCLGYPFFGSGKDKKTRIAHLETLETPMLICQGTRDPLGNHDNVSRLKLSKSISMHWAKDGDHDLKPRKASGYTHEQNLIAALDAASIFLSALN